MQIKQRVVPGEQRTQGIGDAVFKILRLGARSQVAVEVALAIALAFVIGQRVADRHQRQRAAG